MFRFLLRHSSVGVCQCLARCDTAAAAAASVSRAAHGGAVRAFSGSTSVRLCEKKSDAASSDPTEAPAELTQKAADDGQDEVLKVAERSEEPAGLKTEEDGGPTQQQQQTDVEQVTAKHGGGKRSGKESLIDLLGAMKVEVTNKRKLKNKVTQSYESTSKTADLESTITMFQQVTDQASAQSETLDPELVAAASAAASTLPNRSQAESELLRQLRQHEAVSEAQKKGETNELGVIIADMKVGRNPNRQKTWPANQIWFDEDGRGYTDDRENAAETDAGGKRRNLFTGKRLNIFSPTTEEGVESTAARPTLWDVEFAHQLTQATNHTPRNGLEEMIQWTKEGKMWQYPVNNEAGLEEEADVPFHEHIFLDKHLEDGFPRQGPVRHFMELVVAGLSRNPYVTVQQKKEHISWFRDYFHQKEEVLKEAEVYLK
ncbi:small ribosomal subunit protein mS31 [Larimichthys crocea]|uniref:small ribosomal subunit protein mS31 n=1 Tax=Larimichthys crocea TaxID=215358 RepID=UPI000F5E1720|nr:28S ribosomal protein S31, mitochondrial [Larimichthys crocea]